MKRNDVDGVTSEVIVSRREADQTLASHNRSTLVTLTEHNVVGATAQRRSTHGYGAMPRRYA